MQLQETIKPFQNCEVSPNSLALPDNLPMPQWLLIGESIKSIGEGCLWWLGDWLLGGVKQFGDRAMIAATEGTNTGYSIAACKSAMQVSEKVSKNNRLFSLSWSHHREVAALGAKEQKDWLKLAEENKWTVSELRQAIRQDNAHLTDGSEDGEPFAPIASLWMDALRPLRKRENEKPLTDWPDGEIKAVIRVINPAIEFHRRLTEEVERREK